MILIQNKQRTIPLDLPKLKKDIKILLDHLGYGNFSIGIQCVSDKKMQEYNKQFRNKSNVTNILAFPFHHNVAPGKTIVPTSEDEKNLGDLIIAPAWVKKEADQLKQPFYKRLQMLIVHGLCHLLGYNHVNDIDFKKMHALENSLLKLIR